MLKSGWLRLWIVLTGVLLVGVGIATASYVWGSEACYRFVSVTVAEDSKAQDRELAEHIKHEATTETFCGKHEYSTLLTLEDLARRGVVTQVSLQWLEPSGWTFDHGLIDIWDTSKIQASRITSRISTHVYQARFRYALWSIAAAISVSPFSLILGLGIAWVRRGFVNK